jgi:phosphoglycerol transferase MdoB-like AlkP superfamily enzyme
MGAAVVGIRGGLQLKPISVVTAGTHTTARNMPLILNTPFTIAKTIGEKPLKTFRYYKSEEELSGIFTPVHTWKGNTQRKENVVIIILESVSREHIGVLNHHLENGRYQGFTPFLDSLIGQGYYFDAFANGKTSIQGIPAILSAIPSLMNESITQSGYAATEYASIASLLKPFGYTTAFFHGGTNGTMGFDAYTRMTGFDRYYGRTEYNNEKDYDGKWGIRDEEFLQFTANTIQGMQQPFAAAVFTLSSHHPYYVPPRYQNVFRQGKLPIQQSIMYTDHSLARFFYTARHMPWYRNTLFVITADHSSESYYPYYKTPIGQYAIPLLFYKPGSDLKGVSTLMAQQTDILPSILGYLGYNGTFIAFGNDLFHSGSAPRFSIHYLSGIYGLLKDGYYLENDGQRTTALYNLEKDPMQQVNIAGKAGKEQQELERFLRAYVQQYNNRLTENRLRAD